MYPKISTTKLLPEKDWTFIQAFGKIPTYKTVCGNCSTENIWRSTGAIMPIQCKMCHQMIYIDAKQIHVSPS